jgi:PleD family two-component response regulator
VAVIPRLSTLGSSLRIVNMETSGCLERYCCDLVNVLTGDHMNPLRILVADDHEIVRRGLVSLLRSHAGWDVCGEAADGRQALSKAKELRPDITL